jgi:putative resolvase
MNDETTTHRYVKPKEAKELLGVTESTLRRMADTKQIQSIKTDTGRYLYNVSSYIQRKDPLPVNKDRRRICYARVSSKSQKSHLDAQVDILTTQYPDYEIIKDYGSGLNYNRTGLKKILDLACKGELEEIVVTYKDRLCRFGFELIEYILMEQSNAKITIFNKTSTSLKAEFTSDLMSILNTFSVRMHGLKKYKNQIKEDESIYESSPSECVEDDDDDVASVISAI